jgi:APA family basic amino acid/polyamine antiporter
MFSLPAENWWRLIFWVGIGLAVYVFYGRKHGTLTVAGGE